MNNNARRVIYTSILFLMTVLLELPLLLQIGVFLIVLSTFLYGIGKWIVALSSPRVKVQLLKKPLQQDEQEEIDEITTRGQERQVLFFKVTSNDCRNLVGIHVTLTFNPKCVLHPDAEYERMYEGKPPEAIGQYSASVRFNRPLKRGEHFRFPIVITPLKELGSYKIQVEVTSENTRNASTCTLVMNIVDKNTPTSHDWDYFMEGRYRTTK